MLERIASLTKRKLDFGFESTLASRSLARFLREARAQGFRTHIVFLWLDGPDLAVARVRQRVASGGHFVPEETIRRRYWRGIANFFSIYRALADGWRFYDNSWPPAPRLIAWGGAGLDDEILDGTTWTRARSSE
jgi:predicted ABC-type ATPase